MPLLVPSSTQVIPGGSPTVNLIYSGVANTGDIITVHIDTSTRDAGVGRTDYDCYIMNQPAPPWAVLKGVSASYGLPVDLSWTAPGPQPFYLTLFGGGQPPNSSHGTALGYTASSTLASVQLCPYGTRLQPLAQAAYVITPALLDLWLDHLGAPWLARALVGVYYTQLDAAALCANGPPPLPTIDLSTPQASAATILQLVHAVAWPNLCECVPGTPTPTPNPPPVIVKPKDWPDDPTFPCSNVDPCTALVDIQKQLAALSVTLGSNYAMTTLLQRYGQPFEYIKGAVHSNLTGSGSFAISRVVGMHATVNLSPASNQVFTGTPPYVTDLGWLSLATPDGMIDEIRLTRQEQTWVSRLFPLADVMGYALRDGVTIQLQELYAEP